MIAREDTVLKIISGENYTPCGLAEKLGARVVLESSTYRKGKSRHSIMMIDEAFRLVQGDGRISVSAGNLKNSESQAMEEAVNRYTDILDAASSFASQHRTLEFPFPAGGIGYLAYEFAKNCDTVSFRQRKNSGSGEDDIPDAIFLFGHTFLVFDHYTDLIYMLGINYEGCEIDLPKRIGEIEKRIKDLDFNYLVEKNGEYSAEVIYDPPAGVFTKNVIAAIEEIKKGNLLQCVVSRKARIKTNLPAFRAYKKLRSATPSPYMFYLDFSDFQIFGASPEVHLLINEGKAVMRPIAGTRRRGLTAEEDIMLEKELLGDEKEGCEHLMLVDLARNDLGRVCRPGSVKVTESRTIERYSHVMHIVSQVEGELAEGVTGIDALRATFPAGTVTGAPKLKAIGTIDRLEDEKRGFYAGVIGYFEPGGALNSCITIRSGMKKGDVMTLQAGAGIVSDSNPEREYEETREKMRSLAKITGLEV